MTLRLAPEVLAALRLECCDINELLDTIFAYSSSPLRAGMVFSTAWGHMPMVISPARQPIRGVVAARRAEAQLDLL